MLKVSSSILTQVKILALLIGCVLTSSVQAQILPPSYPVSARSITRGLDSTELTIQIAFLSSCTNDTVTVQFPASVSYIAGSVAKLSGSPSYGVSEANISNLRQPKFRLTGITGAGSITFKLKRRAECGSILTGKDTVLVTGSCGSATEANGAINTYRFLAPALSLEPSDPNVNVALNSVYDRTTTLTNGGNGDEDTLFFFIRYTGGGDLPTSPTKEVIANGVSFLPYKTSGDTHFYKFFGDTLFGGDRYITNGERLKIVENIRIINCSPETKYGAAWGASNNEFCQWIYASLITVLDGGVPYIASLDRQPVNYIDRCTPFDIDFVLANGDLGNDTASGMFDVKIQHGYVYPNRTYVAAYNGSIMSLSKGRIGDSTVATFTNAGNIVEMDLKDLFNIDPDGAGGLSDLDGDGYYDDLAGGDTLIYRMEHEWKCNLACESNKVHYSGARVHFNKMCGKRTSTTPFYSSLDVYESSFSGSAHAPANILSNKPFRFTLSEGHYLNRYIDESSKTRYEWKVVLPPGFSVSGSGQPTYGGSPITYSKVGDTLIIKSADNVLGNAEIDLVFTCGTAGSFTFNYSLTKIDNDSTGCRCQGNLVCGSFTTTAFCSSPCSVGPLNYIPSVRRTDSCLGYIDNTLTQRQIDTAISAIDLARALYMDTIQITGTARQQSTVNNLYLEFSLGKTSGGIAKLTPVEIELKVIRGSTTYTYSTSSYTDASTASTQITNWNISGIASLLPGGTMLPNDSIITVSKYVVATNAGLPQNDVQSGGGFNHYSIISGAREYCFRPIAEMYLVGTNLLDGRNPFNTEGCAEVNLGGSGSNLARRFNSSGNLYSNEFRPMFYVDSVVIRKPDGHDLISLTNTLGGGILTADTVIGSDYTYINPGTWKAVGLTRTNTYGARFVYAVQPTCNTPALSTHGIKVYIKDFYYAHLNKSTYPSQHEYILGNGSGNTAGDTGFRFQTVYHKTTDKPELVIQNLSGEIKGTKAEQYWDIELRNDGLSGTGKTWISVEKPFGSNVTVIRAIKLSTNDTLAKYDYGASNSWFPVTDKLVGGGKEIVRVFIGYGDCKVDSVYINTGWGCRDFPVPDPIANNNACEVKRITAVVLPQRSQIQLDVIRQPGDRSPTTLCTKDSIVIKVNSALDGNVIDPKIQVLTPPGIVIFNPVRVEYPFGSGVYRNASPTLITGGFEVDLSGTIGVGANGIPGLIENSGAPERQLRIVLDYLPLCNHISGNPVSFKMLGNSPCGEPAIGNGQISSTEGVHITGASTAGALAMGIATAVDTFNCSTGNQTFTVSTLPLINPTKKGDLITLNLPQGFTYKGNFSNDTNCVNCTILSAPGLGGTTDLNITLDSGSPINTPIIFSFDASAENFGNCGEGIVEARAKRQIPPLTCLGSICASSSVVVGHAVKPVSIKRADYDFIDYNSIDRMIYAPPYKYVYSGKILNTSDVAGGNNLQVKTFFDVNANGLYDQGTDSFIKFVNVSGPISAGETVEFKDSFWSNTTQPSPNRPLYSVIDSSGGNCLCKELEVSTFLNALPIKLISIEIENLSNTNSLLSWSTSQEFNTSHFEIYRSMDNSIFEYIGREEAAGNSNSINSYTYLDEISSLGQGNIYYKIKQVDQNGTSEWTNVVFIYKAGLKESVRIYPNPSDGNVNLSFSNFRKGVYPITLVDALGRTVYSRIIRIDSTDEVVKINFKHLPAGIYNLIGKGINQRLVVKP